MLIFTLLLHPFLQDSLDPEEIPEFQVLLELTTMGPRGKTAFQDFLEPKASLEKSWEQDLEIQEWLAYLVQTETRASQGVQEHPDHPVGLRGSHWNDKLTYLLLLL